jgi:hypothetical protein
MPWNPQVQTIGPRSSVRLSRFGFTTTGGNGLGIVLEACTNVASPLPPRTSAGRIELLRA